MDQWIAIYETPLIERVFPLRLMAVLYDVICVGVSHYLYIYILDNKY